MTLSQKYKLRYLHMTFEVHLKAYAAGDYDFNKIIARNHEKTLKHMWENTGKIKPELCFSILHQFNTNNTPVDRVSINRVDIEQAYMNNKPGLHGMFVIIYYPSTYRYIITLFAAIVILNINPGKIHDFS